TLLRLGDLTRYISHAVIIGFTLGASVLLVLDQLKNFFGLHAQGSATAHFLKRVWLTMRDGGPVHWPTLALGVSTAILAIALRQLNSWLTRRRVRLFIPEFLITVVGMATVVWATGLDHDGVAVVGRIPAALPRFRLPHVNWELVSQLMES